MRKFDTTQENRPVFKRAQIIKLSRLLDMEYKPSEVAEEIDVSTTTIYRNYLQAGCPHRRESSGQIWINGKAFAGWARGINELNKKAGHFTLAENQAWCVSCNQVVEMVDPHQRRIKKNLILVFGKCAKCGGKVNRMKSGKEK